MERKAFEAEVKADAGDTGEFTALVSAFGNTDRVGDRVVSGAFTKTLRAWRESGDPIPVVLSHQWDDPFAHIGVADPKNVRQTARGLLVKGRLDIADNTVARQVYRLMKRRSLKSFSFGYSVPDGGEALADDGIRDLKEVDLFEVGPTLVGANPAAELQAVKSALTGAEDDTEEEPPADPPAETKTERDPLLARILDAQFRVRGIAGKE